MNFYVLTYKPFSYLGDYFPLMGLHPVIKMQHISLVFLIAVMIITITRIYLSLHQLTAKNI
ncbi:MAG TPA: hypothetical protein DIT59_13865 [Leclercia sp.]|uniref:Uncharacterized protein n=1 Tax=Leclercia adecarboxylata TaxID=83655 RepID=A0AAP9AM27_9ENTR|nr:hypothetical protein ES815_18050 [Leclercia adecarboxylata]HCN97734.1 hypothetical protein [Leclercia sp.]